MRKLKYFLALALLGSAPIAAQAGPASDLVRSFYQPEVAFEADPLIRDRFTSPALDVLEKNDALVAAGDEIGCLSFVLSIDAQDYDQSEIDRTLKLTESENGQDAAVTAEFQLFPNADDSGRTILWTLKRVGDQWKIADIASPESEWRLSEFACQDE